MPTCASKNARWLPGSVRAMLDQHSSSTTQTGATMLRVRDIMTTSVTTLAPDNTLREAMERLSAANLSGAPVVGSGGLVGVLSTSDLLSFAATLQTAPVSTPADLAEMEWQEPEDREEFLDTSSPSSTFFAELWDNAIDDVADRIALTGDAGGDDLEQHDVAEIMTTRVWTLPSSADAREAAELMRQHSIHRILVVDDGALVGIVSSLDITRAVADGRFTVKTYLFNRDADFAQAP